MTTTASAGRTGLTRTILAAWAIAFASGAAGDPAPYPNQHEADLVVAGFKLESGAVLPEARLHYTTLGSPHRDANGDIDNAVLVLHGTTGTGKQFLAPTMGPELFAPGAPLDAAQYFVVLTDGLGRGGSSKPSDGLRGRFPRYGYGDVVEGQYRVVTEGLGIRHLRAVIGTSMGGMQAWMWGERHSGMMDGLVAVASQPIPVSGRNALWRRLVIEAIRSDPDYKGGDYETQPTQFTKVLPIFNIMTESVLSQQQAAPTNADAVTLYGRLAANYAGKVDANDWLYWFDSSFDYDPLPRLGEIKAKLLAINFADDALNPIELGVMDPAIRRIPGAQFVLVPASAETHGHQSLRYATLWRPYLAAFMAALGPSGPVAEHAAPAGR
ncbi:alpha/beta fold hydrolase [Methylobacterium sp. J-088]|uniref:alpha/beta fold hydrolase n=1 Tax=Methylobacterium sp. J-088 TaxID=2836664 RepID=UPI001FB9F4CD|nr:alpha/beta fold hydrolase [Methylobacterium sp. J-088]MCJ2064720.1 alpha/beta fold hydrolase [Methylobacterium sp. J-088]